MNSWLAQLSVTLAELLRTSCISQLMLILFLIFMSSWQWMHLHANKILKRPKWAFTSVRRHSNSTRLSDWQRCSLPLPTDWRIVRDATDAAVAVNSVTWPTWRYVVRDLNVHNHARHQLIVLSGLTKFCNYQCRLVCKKNVIPVETAVFLCSQLM